VVYLFILKRLTKLICQIITLYIEKKSTPLLFTTIYVIAKFMYPIPCFSIIVSDSTSCPFFDCITREEVGIIALFFLVFVLVRKVCILATQIEFNISFLLVRKKTIILNRNFGRQRIHSLT